MKVRILKEACGCQAAEPVHQPHMDHGEGKMARGQLYNIVQYATELMQMFDDQTDLPEWVEAKITKAFSYLDDAAHYLQASNAREQGLLDIHQLRAMIAEEMEEMRKKKDLDEKKRKKAGTESSKESSLRDWFGRKGAKGKKSGWVDCNAPDGKGGYKACGREKGEKRKKYPACRPTPGACKERGKGKSWGKKAKKGKKS